MNVLEGLRRLFLVLSLIAVAGAAVSGWSDGGSHYLCSAKDVSLADNPFADLIPEARKTQQPAQPAWMSAPLTQDASATPARPTSDVDLDALRATFEKALKAQQAREIDASLAKTKKSTAERQDCPTGFMEYTKRASYAALYAALTGFFLYAIWAAFRWIFLGFLPSSKRDQR